MARDSLPEQTPAVPENVFFAFNDLYLYVRSLSAALRVLESLPIIRGAGAALIDFGAGSSSTTVDVTGQAAILETSLVCCWLKPADTADHTEAEHITENIKVVAADIVAGTGFTIHAFSSGPSLTGTWSVGWFFLH